MGKVPPIGVTAPKCDTVRSEKLSMFLGLSRSDRFIGAAQRMLFTITLLSTPAMPAAAGDAVIEHGDMLWTDFGISYLRLNTDTQQNAYVLRDGETQAPKGLRDGLAASNRVQDALTSSFRAGDSGNDILTRARDKAIAQGLEPSIYSHPIGYHGHGAGTAMGFWDDQNPGPRGEYIV
jgi:hypothetical protein